MSGLEIDRKESHVTYGSIVYKARRMQYKVLGRIKPIVRAVRDLREIAFLDDRFIHHEIRYTIEPP